jgi:hypothetical protein
MRKFIPDQRTVSFTPESKELELEILNHTASEKLADFSRINLDAIKRVVESEEERDQETTAFLISIKGIMVAAHGGDSFDAICGRLAQVLGKEDPNEKAKKIANASKEVCELTSGLLQMIEEARKTLAKAGELDTRLEACVAPYRVTPPLSEFVDALDAARPGLEELYFLAWINGGEKRLGRPPNRVAREVAYEATAAAARLGRGADIGLGHDENGFPTTDFGGLIDGLFGVFFGDTVDFKFIGKAGRDRFLREIERDISD